MICSYSLRMQAMTTLAQVLERERSLPVELVMMIGAGAAGRLDAAAPRHISVADVLITADGEVAIAESALAADSTADALVTLAALMRSACSQRPGASLRRLLARASRYHEPREFAAAIDHSLAFSDRDALTDSLCALAAGQPLPVPREPRRGRLGVVATVLLAVLLIAGVAAAVVFASGLHHRLLRPHEIGLLTIGVRLGEPPESAIEETALLGVTVTKVGEESTRPIRVALRPQADRHTPGSTYYANQPRYLGTGFYEVRLRYEDRMVVRRVLVDPISSSGTDLQIELARSLQETTQLSLTASDATTGAPLAVTVLVAPVDGSAPFTQAEEPSVELDAGLAYEVRVAADGYYEQRLVVPAGRLESLWSVRIAMIPVAARVLVDSEVDGVQLLLDGDRSYPRGGPNPQTATLAPIEAGEQTLLLVPGSYELTVRLRRETATSTPLQIGAGDTLRVRISREDDELSLVTQEER